MKAAVRDRYGSPDVVALTEVDRPVPSDGQVLVRVRAASVNRADLDGLKPRPGFASRRYAMSTKAVEGQSRHQHVSVVEDEIAKVTGG